MDRGSTEPADEYIHFSMGRGMAIINNVHVSFEHKRIISAVKRVESVSDWMS
jgi:hypothetical protein